VLAIWVVPALDVAEEPEGQLWNDPVAQASQLGHDVPTVERCVRMVTSCHTCRQPVPEDWLSEQFRTALLDPRAQPRGVDRFVMT
jgi:hypothetical protein